MPVGGIKEKILAAKRAGIKFILLPASNQKDVEDIKSEYLKGLTFNYVKKMEDVIKYSLKGWFYKLFRYSTITVDKLLC